MDILESNCLLCAVDDALIFADMPADATMSYEGTAVADIEANFGRELRFATFTTEDFAFRVDVKDRLLRDVFDYPHEIIVDKLI